MQIENIPYLKIDWDGVSISKHAGETGNAYIRTIESGNIRIRMLEFSPGYKGAHWCCRGHIIHLLEGDVVLEMKDGNRNILKRGMTLCVSNDDQNPHRAYTKNGEQLFTID